MRLLFHLLLTFVTGGLWLIVLLVKFIMKGLIFYVKENYKRNYNTSYDDKEQDAIATYIHEETKNRDDVEVLNDIDCVVIRFYEGSEDVTITI